MHVWISLLAALVAIAVAEDEGLSIDQMILGAEKTSSFSMSGADEDGGVIVEGDMVFTKEQWEAMNAQDDTGLSKRKGIKNPAFTWITGIVPYQIWNGFNQRDRNEIQKAINDWNKYTCVKLQPRRGEKDWMYIGDGDRCSSAVGKSGGRQNMKLSASGCRHYRLILHELGHALGLHHEQTRPDRDDYITVNMDNVDEEKKHNFVKKRWNYIDDQGVPYDYSSIMQYGETAFSKNNQVTIITKDDYYQKLIGKSQVLAFSDVKIVNKMYKCGKHCPGSCPGDGYMDKNCVCQCKDGNPFRSTGPIKPCTQGGGAGGAGGSGACTNSGCQNRASFCSRIDSSELDAECADPGSGIAQMCCQTCEQHNCKSSGGGGGSSGGSIDPNCKDKASFCSRINKAELAQTCTDVAAMCCKTCHGYV